MYITPLPPCPGSLTAGSIRHLQMTESLLPVDLNSKVHLCFDAVYVLSQVMAWSALSLRAACPYLLLCCAVTGQ